MALLGAVVMKDVTKFLFHAIRHDLASDNPNSGLDWRLTLNRSRFVILDGMDHLAVRREKIGSLRAEIAALQELDHHCRRYGRNAAHAEAQFEHDQRLERLQAIQQELAQLAGLGGRVLSVEQRKAEHRSRLKKAS
jgi:hypothetical protein